MSKLSPIATWSFAPFLKGARLGNYNKYDLLVFIILAERAINSFRYIGTPTIYTDSIGEICFSSFDCNIVNCYDDAHNDVDVRLWAYTKILTYKKQVQPYLHFDLDFVLKREIDIPSCDVFVQCKDTYHQTFTNDLKSTGLDLPDEFNDTLLDNSWTVGVLGMFDMDLNEKYTSMAQDYFIINSKNADTWRNTTMSNTILEQQMLALHTKDKEVKCLSDSECFDNDDFKHYVSHTKKSQYACHFFHNQVKQRHYDILRKVQDAIHSRN